MKKSRLKIAVLLGLSLFLLAENLYPQTASPDELTNLIDFSVMNSYLDTADRQLNQQQWLDYASFGMGAVLAVWEKEAMLLTGEDFDLTALRVEAEASLNDVIETRLISWLSDNFFNTADPAGLGVLSRKIEDLNGLYLYEIQEDGSIRYKTSVGYDDLYTEDGFGNPVLEQKGEKTLWAEGVRSTIAELTALWTETMVTAFTDLKTSITDQGLMDRLETAWTTDLDSYRENYINRLTRLYSMEQSRFAKLRLYDQYSLQHLSETETAGYISNELIARTQAELNTELNALVSGLDAQIGDVNIDGGIIDADAWQESFRSLLEQGLDSWDAAEEELLMERIQWEQTASQETAAAEEAWAEAFAELRVKRSEWMTDYRKTLEEGNRLWVNENDALEAAIEKAIADLDASIENSTASLQSRIDNLVGMLLQSVNMMRTARTSWEYWMDKVDGGARGSFEAGSIDFDADSMLDAMMGYDTDSASYKEAGYWLSLFDTYGGYASDSQQSLAKTYGIVVFDDESVTEAFDDGQLNEALFDESLLEDPLAWESFYLDSFQVELLKAKAYMQYWEKQQEIAQAVYDYASDESSTKEDAAETEAKLLSAKTDYETALSNYTELLDRLTGMGEELGALQDDMKTIQLEIDGYQQDLSDARDDYNQILNDLYVDNPAYLSEQYREYYLQLLDSYGMLSDSDAEDSLGFIFEEYLLAAKAYDLEAQITLVSGHVVELLSGGNDNNLDGGPFISETASLAELHERMEITSAAGFISGDAGDSGLYSIADGSNINAFTAYLKDSLMLQMDDYYYEPLVELFNLYHDENERSRDGRTRSEILWEMQIIVRELQDVCSTDYELRLAELRLYTTDDFTAWGEQYFGTADYDEITAFSQPDRLEALSEAVAGDIAVYDVIIDLYDDSEDFTIYDWSDPVDSPGELAVLQAYQRIWDFRREDCESDAEAIDVINAVRTSLTALKAWLEALGELRENIPALETALLAPDVEQGQDYLAAYLNGGYNLSSGSGDLHSYIYYDIMTGDSLKYSIAEMLRIEGEQAPALSQIQYELMRDELLATLVDGGMLDSAKMSFVSPEAFWEHKAFADVDEVVSWFGELDKLGGSGYPAYLTEMLDGYLDDLKTYTAMRAGEKFTGGIPLDLSILNGEIRAQSEMMSDLTLLGQQLLNRDDDLIKFLNLALSDDFGEEFRASAEARMIETAGFDLALLAAGTQDFTGDADAWDELYADYMSKTETAYFNEEGFDSYKHAMTERAAALYELSSALIEPESADWSAASAEKLEIYRAMLWNSLGFDAAERMITGNDAAINLTELFTLRLIDQLMPDSADDFPEDVGLAWMYGGDEALQDVDQLITAGAPLLWADQSFSPAGKASSRYYSDDELEAFASGLALSPEEITAGITPADKAAELWNDEFLGYVAAGTIEGALRASAGLMLIDSYMNDTGGYGAGYAYGDLLSDLLTGLSLSKDDEALFVGIAADPDVAVAARLDAAVSVPADDLSGEELYWNLMWRAREIALDPDYNEAGCRDNLIFGGGLSDALSISSWIDAIGVDADYQDYAGAQASGLEDNAELLIQLGLMEEGGIYLDITAAGIAALLTEEAGWTIVEAVDFINWFMDAKGVPYNSAAADFDDYLAAPEEQRLLTILDDYPEAAVHHLKTEIIAGEWDYTELEERLAGDDSLIDDAKDGLLALKANIDSLTVYKPLLYGDFENYLGTLYEDEADRSVLREALGRYYGSPQIQWDDPVFCLPLMMPELTIPQILENLAYNRSRKANSTGLNPVSAMSTNEVFLNNAALIINNRLYAGDDSESARLVLLQNERNLASRAESYLNSEITEDNDNWRSFLNEFYLNSDDDEHELIPEGYSNGADYDRDLTINEGDDVSALEVFSDPAVFSGIGNDQSNILFDAENECLDRAAFLTAAFEIWTAEDSGFELTGELTALNTKLGTLNELFWNSLDTADYGDLSDDYLYDPDSVKLDTYNEASYKYHKLDAKIASLKDGMSEFGRRREQFERLSGLGSEAQIAALERYTGTITDLEVLINEAQADWQALITGDDDREGYSTLEQEYADDYEATRAAIDNLDIKKHEYAIARSIYQFASAGYLSVDEETLAIFNPVEEVDEPEEEEEDPDEEEPEQGIVGGTAVASDVEVDSPTPEQLYRDALLETINKVSPAERLSYVNDKLNRAAAACNALSTIMGRESEDFSTYSGDEVYRAHFDSYIKTFRESLVINKINYVLNKAIATQESKTAEALSDWDEIMADSYGSITYLDENGDAVIPDGLETLELAYSDSDDSWNISWDGEQTIDAETAEDYFSPDEDSATGHSAYEEDLVKWLGKVSTMQSGGTDATATFTTWAMALKWEDYQALDKNNDEDVSNFWSVYLDRNCEEDLDFEGARDVLVKKWEDAYNIANSGSADQKWMFNFYKLLDKSGMMQIATGEAAEDSFELLAKQESIILANQYMADEQREGAEGMILSAIPIFTMAALYFSLAWVALANPFTFFGGLFLLGLAVGFSLLGGSIQGEGFAKRNAADNIETEVVAKSEAAISKFESAFKLDTDGILDKKALYDAEYDKLLTMKGEADEGEDLTDEQRITKLQDSVEGAFSRENEDLHLLLVQAGLVVNDGNSAADRAALALLFGNYYNDSVKVESSSSSRFISALGEAAHKYKQITARELNDYLTGQDGIAQKQADAEAEYETAYYDYIREEITLDEFVAASEAAWYKPKFSIREHLLRLYEEQDTIASMIMGSDQFSADISSDLLASQKLLLGGDESNKGIYDYRMDNYRDVKMYEMEILRLEMNEKRRHWEAQMDAITARGELEWSAGERKLNRKYREWRDETRRTYVNQKEGWDDKYIDFLGDKQLWFDAVTLQSTDYGNNEVLENFGEMTAAAVAAAGTDMLIADFTAMGESPDEILASLIDFELLGNLLENAVSLNSSIGDASTVIFTAAVPEKFTTADSLQEIKDFQLLQNEEYEKHLAKLEFERLLDQVVEAEQQFSETIEDANKSMSVNLHSTMRDDGYTLNGNRYERSLVVGSTYSEYIYEDAYVSRYEDYAPGGDVDLEFSEDLEAAETDLDNLDADSLKGLVAKAMNKIEQALKSIFGDDEDLDTYMYEDIGITGSESKNEDGEVIFDFTRTENAKIEEEPGLIEKGVTWFLSLWPEAELTDEEKAEAAEKKAEDAKKKFAELSPGYFGLHVGYAPSFFDDADTTEEWDAEGQIRYDGYGQMGRIMGEFIFNKIKEGAGWAEVNMPHYKKRLWDDTDSWIKAPSIADLTSLAVTVVTMGAYSGGSTLISAGINLIDDAALNIADVVVGEQTWDEGLVNFGKTAFSSLATTGLNPGVDTSSMGLGEILLNNAGSQFSNNLISCGVNSITYESGGNFGYDVKAFEEGVFGVSAIAGCVGSAVGTMANSGLSSLTTGSWTEVEKAFYGSALNLGEMAADQAAQYAVHAGFQLAEDGFDDIGGSLTTAFDNMDLSFNVLDIGSLMDMTRLLASTATGYYSDTFMSGWNTAANNLKGTGLFAMNISSSGITGEITTGGVNIGSSLYDLGKGFTMDIATRSYAEEHKDISSEIMRKGYAFGDQGFEDTIWRILAGKDSLDFDNTDGEAKTIKNKEGGRNIHMNSSYTDAQTDEDLLKAVVELQHESHRDGVINNLNTEETARAVRAHTEIALSLSRTYNINFMAGDENLLVDVAAYIASMGGDSFDAELFNEYVAGTYDSSADYWKLVENPDGSLTLHDDGRGGVFYTDENGEEHEIGHYTGGSRTGHLQKILGLNLTDEEKARLNNEMLVGLGSAETYKDGHFIDTEGNQISIDLTGEWSDRMGAALDYDRMFVDAWRSDGNMDMMIEELRYMNISEKYGADYSDREKYLADMYDKAIDFSARFEAGTATEHLFSQTEIENAIGFGKNALCYGTVPVNMYQMRDPSISLDMVANTVTYAFSNKIIRKDGYIREYNKYLKSLGKGLGSSQYLKQGSDFSNLKDYLKSDYSMADYGIYGEDDNEHHTLYRNGYDAIDPYPYSLSWQEIKRYRYRGLEWVDF